MHLHRESVLIYYMNALKVNNMAKKNWIQSAIKHPGRCKHPGSSQCPKGSPQYNLAMRFKKGGDLHKSKKS